jgi:Icc-related predicted phosphoesterase
MRVAAVGDVHLGEDLRGRLRPRLSGLSEAADVLLLAGDLTQHGTVAEAQVVAEEFAGLGVPVAAVLGNHDYHSGQEAEITKLLTDSGMTVLEGSGTVFDLPGGRLGVAGSKGFGGGFPGRCASEFGEPEMKAFVRHSKELAASLAEALQGLDSGTRIALTHYAPVPDTLAGEPPEIYAFLGSYFLAEAGDACGADLMLHGHAHAGTEKGLTPGGVAVRNVALPVLGCAYAVYCLASATPVDCADEVLTMDF